MKRLIVTADDLGASAGINRGIAEAHLHGVVTSASLMVTGRAAREAAAMLRDLPALSVGLHWDVWGEDEREFDLSDLGAVREEFARQLDAFEALLGRLPTHVDSHRHAHRHDGVRACFRDLVAPLGLPLRGEGRVRYVGGFYAQWEWGITDLAHVGVPFLEQVLREEVEEGWTELGCHPGYRSPGFHSIYDAEREAELRTLTDPRVREALGELGIELCAFAELAGAAGR